MKTTVSRAALRQQLAAFLAALDLPDDEYLLSLHVDPGAVTAEYQRTEDGRLVVHGDEIATVTYVVRVER